MSNEYYTVDGLRCNTIGEAEVLAERLFTRYDGTRSITITQVVEESYELDVRTLEAVKESNELCPFTMDLFE